MTDTVITSDNTTAVVSNSIIQSVVVEDKTTTTIVTGLMGPPGSGELYNLSDVDLSQLAQGSVLAYDQTTQKWVATNRLEHQVFEAGQY